MQFVIERHRLHDLAHADAVEIQDEGHQHGYADDAMADGGGGHGGITVDAAHVTSID